MKNLILGLMAKNGITPPPLPCAPGTPEYPCDDPIDISSILGWVYFAIGVVGAIMIIMAGIQYMTSQGEPEKTKKAQATITYTVVGIIIALVAATIVGFVAGAFA